MENQTLRQFPDRLKYLPSIVGSMVAIIHFVIVHNLLTSSTLDQNQNDVIFSLILIGPSFFLTFLFPFSLQTTNFVILDFLVRFLYIGFSSSYYGITVGFFISKNRKHRWIAVVLLCLVILTGCFFIFMIAQSLA